MVTFSHLEVCADFSKEAPFATAYFSKVERGGSRFLANSMQNRLYTFGIVCRGLESEIPKLWDLSRSQATERLTELFKDESTEGIECYDITMLEVSDGKYRSVKFDDNELETFHRAFVGTREECLADLKRQFEKNKEKWDLVDA